MVIPTLTSKDPNSATDPGNVVARVRRVFQKEVISLWRYALFFDDDMEIHPGPAMDVTGDVHTNGSLYTGHKTLTLSGKTTYTDSWTIGFMSGDGVHSEPPTSPKWPTNLPPASDQEQQPYGVHLDDYHALIDYNPASTELDPYRFQDQAGYVIAIDSSNNVKIYNDSGKDITGKSGNSNDAKAARALQADISTNQTITDRRVGATTGNGSIRLTTLDVGELQSAMDSTAGNTNFNITKTISGTGQTINNLIYIVDTSASADGTTTKRGIRIKNGGTLPEGGLTIASGNPVYVQGDYNTGSVASSVPGVTLTVQPESNTGDPTKPTVDGYNRQPAAIVADAVNILSNS